MEMKLKFHRLSSFYLQIFKNFRQVYPQHHNQGAKDKKRTGNEHHQRSHNKIMNRSAYIVNENTECQK
ncbi:MAG: hypothetical protein COZ92_00800 [Candidatus Nealsonbacteria bacterium CG_4_8_14_3_um_filter_40_11]|uniref:Uncharacterized protein n=1 Tax=Candidatus Nealsonbacteria bacterium CG_4_8_14_3_um_filter_40_11 TaxID=1974690 RepID=A0A2M7IKF2_9BACT|nr:MAG: hypothetical protein COZ92_00800 [Candidatus Nealsonbacteria bacterium CG_4_8_14_3_um_filter_40_11]